LAHGYTSFGRLIKKFTEHKDRDKEVNDRKTVLISRILQIMENWPKVSKDHIQKVEIIPIIRQLQGLNLNDDITSACVRLLDRWSKFEALQRIKKSENALEKNSIILDDRRRERQKLSSPTRSTPSVVESTDGTDFIEGEFFTEVDAKRGLHPDWACAFDASQEKYYFYSKTSQETRWEKPTVSVPVVQSNNNGFSNVPGNNFNNNNAFSNNFVQYTDEEKEQYRQKKEREEKRRREQEILNKRVKQDNSIQEVIRRAKEEDERKRQEEIDRLRIIEEQRAKKKEQYKKKMLAKQKAKAKHESSRPSSASSESSEKVWKIFFAQHVPNMLKKYLEEIGKDNLKKCAKDLIDQLVSKEVKKGKAPPSKLDSEKYKKIKELVSIHMEKFLIKYRARQKRKLGEGSESSVSETNGKKQHS
jgi:histone-lysine N-methyltransferase SETD2